MDKWQYLVEKFEVAFRLLLNDTLSLVRHTSIHKGKIASERSVTNKKWTLQLYWGLRSLGKEVSIDLLSLPLSLSLSLSLSNG